MLIQSRVIAPHVRIGVRRMLPGLGEIITGVGQSVNPMQTVARAVLSVRYRVLPLSDILQVAPEALPEMLLVEPGARVKQGTLLVDKKGFLGRRQQYESPLDGEFYRVDNGRLILRQTSDIYELRALVAGQVIEHFPQRGVLLETFGSLIQVAWATRREEAGLLNVVTLNPTLRFTPEQLLPDYKSAILVVGWFDQPEVLQRAREAGVRAIICGSLPAELCPLAEAGDLPVFATDGIGRQGLSAPVFDILRAAQGKRTALLGAQISGERAQIVIQVDKKTTEAPKAATTPLAVGQRVLLLRAPYQNQVAEVRRLYHLVQTTESGVRAQGADVRLADGRTLFIPYANMEAII
jgi:hypothetical protein